MRWVLHSRGWRLWALNQAAKGVCGGGKRGKVLNKVGLLGRLSIISVIEVGGSAA